MDPLSLIDHATAGNRCEVTPVFADPAAFAGLLDRLLARLAGVAFDRVAAVDALGFALGAGLATRAGAGLVLVRKAGKLPVAPVDRAEFTDYTGTRKGLELRPDAVPAGARVLVADEWLETGAQVRATIQLVEGRGGVVVGVAAIHIDPGPRADLFAKGYRCFVASDG